MRNTKRRPVTVGEMLVSEFLEPMNIEQWVCTEIHSAGLRMTKAR